MLGGQRLFIYMADVLQKTVSQTDCLKRELHDLDLTRTRNLLIWKQTRYHFAAKFRQRFDPKKKLYKIVVWSETVYV